MLLSHALDQELDFSNPNKDILRYIKQQMLIGLEYCFIFCINQVKLNLNRLVEIAFLKHIPALIKSQKEKKRSLCFSVI